jgi:uncharacterized membrane protein YfcA
METYEIVGFILAIVMGLTLGLFGGGGSILTVPILVYVFKLNPVLATAYSLFVVGFSALIGAIRKHFDGEIAYKIGFLFALPSILSVYATRRFLIPFIPDTIAELGSFILTKDLALMLFFAVVMLIAAYSMIRGRKNSEHQEKVPSYPLVVLEGVIVGVITGLVGAGGGFLIVPALVLLVGLSMKEAVATSLVIIALKSLIGFTGDISSGQAIDWKFLILFTAFSIAGMIGGLVLAKKIDSQKLKKAFGYFVLVMAVFILVKELL